MCTISDVAGVAAGVVVSLAFLLYLLIPLCVACLYIGLKKKRGRKFTPPRSLHPTADVVPLATIETLSQDASHPAVTSPVSQEELLQKSSAQCDLPPSHPSPSRPELGGGNESPTALLLENQDN